MPKICSIPFRMFEVSLRGDVYLCVNNWADFPIGNLQLQDAIDIWNGEKAQEFRASILDGSYRYCDQDKCPWLSSPDELGNPFVCKPPELPSKPAVVNVAYDKTCNLYCVSCRRYLDIDRNYQRHELLRKKIEDMGDVGQIIFIGSGDPFASPHIREWLGSWDVKAEKIYLHTNGFFLDRSHWEAIPYDTRRKIRSVEVSLDAATATTYESIRRGSDWKVVMRNLGFISELRRNCELDYLKLSFVVQEDNFREMPQFVTLGHTYQADDIYFSRMEDWGSFMCGTTESRQVHLPEHPQHEALKEILNHPLLLNDPKVRIGNLRRVLV